jgi:hypothetical protein
MWIDGVEVLEGFDDLAPMEVAALDQLRAEVDRLRSLGVIEGD